MSIPTAITPITVSGKFVRPDGTPAAGVVRFTPSITAVTPGAIVPISPLAVSLDDAGAFSVILAATDDPQWVAAGFTYTVTEQVRGAQERSYSIEVPAAGDPLDLAVVVPVVSVTSVSPYLLAAGGTVRGTLSFSLTAVTDHALEARVAGDATPRLVVYTNGKIEMGNGATRDVNLYRGAPDVLQTDDTFAIGAAATLLLGSTGDVNLYRAGADLLATDDGFAVSGDLQHWGAKAGFFGTAARGKPVVSGAKGANAALASLLTALVNLGLITDSTTA